MESSFACSRDTVKTISPLLLAKDAETIEQLILAGAKIPKDIKGDEREEQYGHIATIIQKNHDKLDNVIKKLIEKEEDSETLSFVIKKRSAVTGSVALSTGLVASTTVAAAGGIAGGAAFHVAASVTLSAMIKVSLVAFGTIAATVGTGGAAALFAIGVVLLGAVVSYGVHEWRKHKQEKDATSAVTAFFKPNSSIPVDANLLLAPS